MFQFMSTPREKMIHFIFLPCMILKIFVLNQKLSMMEKTLDIENWHAPISVSDKNRVQSSAS